MLLTPLSFKPYPLRGEPALLPSPKRAAPYKAWLRLQVVATKAVCGVPYLKRRLTPTGPSCKPGPCRLGRTALTAHIGHRPLILPPALGPKPTWPRDGWQLPAGQCDAAPLPDQHQPETPARYWPRSTLRTLRVR